MDHSQHSIHGHGHSAMPDITHQHMHDVVASTESTPPAMDHHAHNVHTAMEHGMSMAFHFGYDEVILFSPWKISTVAGLIGSMFAIFVMATLYEGLKYYREYLFWKTYNLLEYRPVSMPEKGAPPDEARPAPTVHYVGEVIHKQPGAESNDSELSQPQIKKVTKPSMLSWMHLYQTFLHIIQVTLSFLLMLIFMTYNVWLCLAVVLGAAVGYFLFCWKKSVIVDVTEHCH